MEEREFEVVWKIDITAKTAQEAAEKALEIQRDKKSLATVFIVRETRYPSSWTQIDLE